jgi:uncharacterized protein YdaU (DUF1376 family)
VNYVEFHLRDYMGDAGHLSMLEDSAYRRLLDAYYIRERPLPADLKECCKLAKANSKPECAAVSYVLQQFFYKGDDGYFHQKRADREIERFRQKSGKAKINSMLGVLARQLKAEQSIERSRGDEPKGQPNGEPKGLPLQSPSPSPQAPIKKKTLDRAAAHPVDDAHFESLKAIYPKRIGSQRWPDAKKFCKRRLSEGHTWEELIDGTKRYAGYCISKGIAGTDFVQQAGTFYGENKGFAESWKTKPYVRARTVEELEAEEAAANAVH